MYICSERQAVKHSLQTTIWTSVPPAAVSAPVFTSLGTDDFSRRPVIDFFQCVNIVSSDNIRHILVVVLKQEHIGLTAQVVQSLYLNRHANILHTCTENLIWFMLTKQKPISINCYVSVDGVNDEDTQNHNSRGTKAFIENSTVLIWDMTSDHFLYHIVITEHVLAPHEPRWPTADTAEMPRHDCWTASATSSWHLPQQCADMLL